MSKNEVRRLDVERDRILSGRTQAWRMCCDSDNPEALRVYGAIADKLSGRLRLANIAYFTACERMARAKRRGRRVP